MTEQLAIVSPYGPTFIDWNDDASSHDFIARPANLFDCYLHHRENTWPLAGFCFVVDETHFNDDVNSMKIADALIADLIDSNHQVIVLVKPDDHHWDDCQDSHLHVHVNDLEHPILEEDWRHLQKQFTTD